jgi:hypothetical protein
MVTQGSAKAFCNNVYGWAPCKFPNEDFCGNMRSCQTPFLILACNKCATLLFLLVNSHCLHKLYRLKIIHSYYFVSLVTLLLSYTLVQLIHLFTLLYSCKLKCHFEFHTYQYCQFLFNGTVMIIKRVIII